MKIDFIFKNILLVKMSDFGIIFHWGPYAIPGYDDIKSERRRRMNNGSEWYLKRLTENGSYRPLSGWKETQKFHHENYPNKTYDYFYDEFTKTSSSVNFDKWMIFVKSIGVSYVILTSRHHDGYCLWPSEFAKNHSERDLIADFKSSAEKHGLRWGIYYSWMEFNISVTKKYVDNVIVPQMNELKKYSPSIWWFDGSWKTNSQYANNKIKEIVNSLSPADVNDRLYGKKFSNFDNEHYIGDGATFRVYGDRGIPKEIPNVPWEYIDTIALSWGYNRDSEDKDYKSGESLLKLYNIVNDKGGKFLLNMGPDSHGNFDKREVSSLKIFYKLLKKAYNF